MGKNVFLIVLVVVSVAFQGCNRPTPPCMLYHYKNAENSRAATSFADDTLSIPQLVERYNSFVDGDTISVTGLFQGDTIVGYRTGIWDYTEYLYTDDELEDTGEGWHHGWIQFLQQFQLWLSAGNEDIWDNIENGDSVVVKGKLHLMISVLVADACEEHCVLEVISCEKL